MKHDRIRSLDVASLDVTSEGLQNFAWPVSWREHGTFRDRFLANYATTARDLLDGHPEDGELLGILAMEFVQEAMRGWFAATLMARFNARSEQVAAHWLRSDPVDSSAFWLPQRDRIGFLRSRFPASAWRALLRPAFGLWQRDGLSWRWPETVDFRNRIIATNPCPLTRLHAAHVGETPVLVSLRHWFGEASVTLPANLQPYRLRHTTVDSVLDGLVDAATAIGDTLPAGLLTHLRNWLDEAAPVCRWYLEWLMQHPERLPARLWTGSGGYIFRRILHVAVRRAGGHCWSHDHGSGLGLFDTPDTNLTEFATPDTFVTFSAVQAEGYRTQRREAFRLRRHWPEISHLKARVKQKAPRELAPPSARPFRNILFVANQYRGEKIPLTPIEFDVVAADWQARLLHQLHHLGYQVHFRSHPDSPSPPPAAFTAALGAVPSIGSFAEALDAADIVILDYLHTTVLRDILFSGKPAMTFEFGHCPPNSVAKEFLARRINFIPGWYDAENRAHTDWQQLPTAIAQARALSMDMSFMALFETGGNQAR